MSMNSKVMVLAMLLINMKRVTSKAFADYDITLVQEFYHRIISISHIFMQRGSSGTYQLCMVKSSGYKYFLFIL